MMRHRQKSLRDNRSGTASIEFVLIASVVILLLLGGFTTFDIVRSYQRIVEANRVVSDQVSRQTSIDKTFFNNIYGVFVNLQDGSTKQKALRVSSIVRDGKNFTIAWSKEAGDKSLLARPKLDPRVLPKILPDIASGDSLIFVESARKLPVIFSILGFDSITYKEHAFARPRFTNAVAYTGK